MLAAVHKELSVIIFNKSRGGYVLDAYFDGYAGNAVTDGWAAYRRFDPGGKHQRCWAHELRLIKHLAHTYGGDYKKLYGDLCSMYEDAKNKCNMPSAKL